MKLIVFYIALVGIGVGLFLGINSYGLKTFGNEYVNSYSSFSQSSTFSSVLLALVTIIAVSRLCGFILKKLGQPSVMGEVLGGILLGPSFFSHFAPGAAAILISPTTLPYLNIFAQIGILLYMFLVGLELNLSELKKSAHSTMIISHSSILFPFILGSILALALFKEMAPANVNFTSFALFMGVSMSVTAFPVLARILSDRGLTKTPMGMLALTCAAIDDITAWCLLALVVGTVQAKPENVIYVIFLTIIFIAFMFFIVRPLIAKVSEKKLSVFFIAILLFGYATETIGIHAIFGAFIFGAIIPHDSAVARDLDHKLQDIVRILFLPAFFAYTGMKTQVGLLETSQDWLLCLVIIFVAVLGKLLGTLFVSRILKYSWRDSWTLGILMNTRGLVELIVLNVGLDLGILSPRLFTMLVLMAIVTTFMTGPLLSLFHKEKVIDIH